MPGLRYARRALLGAALVALPACYDYVPVTTSPPVGEIVALDITDRGRVDLADRFGPGVGRIEGRLMSAASDQYVVAVSRVTQINGETAAWTGEKVTLSRDVVGSVQNRKFARGRSALIAAVATAGVVGFIISRNGNSNSTTTIDTTGGKPPAMLRIPIGRFVF